MDIIYHFFLKRKTIKHRNSVQDVKKSNLVNEEKFQLLL